MANLIEEGIIQKAEPTGDLRDYFTGNEFNDLLEMSKPKLSFSRVAGAAYHQIKHHPSNIASALQQVRQESVWRPSKAEIDYRDEKWIDNKLFTEGMSDVERTKIYYQITNLTDKGLDVVEAKRKVLFEREQSKKLENLEWLTTIENAETFKIPAEYKTSSSGFIEDVTRGLFGSLPDLATMAVSPPLGVAIMWANMAGGKFQSLEDIGVPPDRARQAAFTSASYQTPLELVGNLFQLKAIMKAKTGWQDVVVDALGSFMGEGATEIVQQYPDELATFWALHPDLSPEEMRQGLIDVAASPETFANAVYAGAVGGVAGAAMSTVGGTLNYAINGKQMRLNQELEDQINFLMEKLEKDTLTPDDTAKLYEMIGVPPDATDQEKQEAVQDIKDRVFYQEPITNKKRDSALKNIAESKKYSQEQTDAFATIWDSIARSWAYRTGNKPAAWYDKYFGGFKEAEFNTFRAERGDVFQMAGEKAIGADKGALSKAQGMLEKGTDKKKVWEETGWLLGAEGKWKFEIDDSGAKTKKETFKYGEYDKKDILWRTKTLNKFLDHPKLFKAYPQLKDILTTITIDKNGQGSSGSFTPGLEPEMRINVNSISDVKNVLLHEIQHAIQVIEGFAVGGTPEGMRSESEQDAIADREKAFKKYERLAGEIEARDAQTRKDLPAKPKGWGFYDKNLDEFFPIAGSKKEVQAFLKGLPEENQADLEIKATPSRKDFPYEAQGIPEDQWIITKGAGTSFQVSGKQPKPQGAITNLFNSMPKVIYSFESANVSTPIHETGHLLTQMIWENEDKTDYYVLTDSMGIPPDRAELGTEAWTTEEHEQIAKSFERYMMNGEAPTHRLQMVFAKMKEWLLSVYRSVKAMGVNLKPEVREVFDKWLTVPAEYADFIYRDSAEWFRVDAAGLPIDYGIKHDQTDMEEYDKVTAAARAQVTAKLSADRKAEDNKMKKIFQKEAKRSIEGIPLYRMLKEISTGEKRGGVPGIDLKGLQFHYSGEQIKELQQKRPGLVRKGGTPADVVADSYGYESADEMINEIMDTPSMKDAVESYYNDLWDEYDRYYDMSNPDTYEDYINAEIDIFSKMLFKNKRAKVRKDLKKIIRETTNQIKGQGARQLKEDLRRDEQVAKKAWLEGKKEGRVVEKERVQKIKDAKIEAILKLKAKQKARIQQLRQNYTASKRRETILRSLRKSINQKSVTPQHAAQIQAVLSPYYKFAKKKETMVPPLPWPDYLEELVESGDEAAASALSNLIFDLPDPKLKIIPIDGLEKIYQIVKIVKHISKVEQQLLAIKEKNQLNEYVQERIETIRTVFKDQSIGTPISPLAALREKDNRSKFLNSTTESVKKYLAELKKAEFIFMDLDGTQAMGKNHEVFETIAQAENAERILGEKTFDKIRTIFDPFRKNKKWRIEKFKVKDLSVEFTKEELIMIALNAGNKGNLNALKHGYGIELKHVRWIRQHLLSDKEKQLIKDIWKIYEDLYPLSNAIHQKMTGVPLRKVNGHYFPLKFDPEISDKAAGFEEAKNLRDAFAAVSLPTFVRAGSWKKRIGGRMPPWLSFEVINRTVREEIHAITHKVAVRDTQKIIKHKGYKKAVQDALGAPVYKQLPMWLDHVARPEDPTQLEYEKWLYKIRRNITIAYLGWKVTVAMQQPLGYAQTIEFLSMELGAKGGLSQAMKGLSLFYKDPKGMVAFVKDRSIYISNRRKSRDRDIMLAEQKFTPMDKETSIAKESFFALIQLMDASVVYPTWVAAYDLAMSDKFGWDEQKAIAYADHAVRTTQDAAAPKDLSNIHKGQGIQKLFVMFYTFFSTFINKLGRTVGQWHRGQISTTEAVLSLWWISVFPAIASGFIQRRRIQDGWEWLTDILSYNVAGLPFIRDIVNPALTGFKYTMSPVEGGLQVPSRIAKILLKSKDPLSLKLLKTSISGVGAAKGIPSSAMNLFVSGAVDLAEGKTKNPFRLVLPRYRAPKKHRGRRHIAWQ
jgi:hypothetical protein